jgi:hypothetical protein
MSKGRKTTTYNFSTLHFFNFFVMRKQNLNTRKTTATASKAEQTAPESAPLMHVNPAEAAAEQPAQDAAPEAAPAAEVEQPSPLTLATDAPEQPAPAFIPLLEARPLRTMDELLELVAQGKGLTDRLTGLRSTNEKLSSFTVGREGFTDRLTLRDGNGLEWNTTQGVVIQKVLNVLRAELRDAINTTESELRQLLPAA